MHIGELIYKVIGEDGRTKAEVAAACGFTRNNMNHIIGRANIDSEQLLLLSKVLNYDFFRHYSALIPFAKCELPLPQNSQIHEIAKDFEEFREKAEKIIGTNLAQNENN
jgi:hypothetical protein